MKKLSPGTVALLGAAALVLYVFFSRTGGGQPLVFSAEGISNVGQTLAPLVAIAAFIERAVEVVISAARDVGAMVLQEELSAATAKGDDAGAATSAKRRLEEYKLQTRRISFVVSLGLSGVASLVGVRAVSALLDRAALASLSTRQHLGFTVFDVLLTTLLLSGGSDGIHQVVTTITTYLDANRSAARRRA